MGFRAWRPFHLSWPCAVPSSRWIPCEFPEVARPRAQQTTTRTWITWARTEWVRGLRQPSPDLELGVEAKLVHGVRSGPWVDRKLCSLLRESRQLRLPKLQARLHLKLVLWVLPVVRLGIQHTAGGVRWQALPACNPMLRGSRHSRCRFSSA